MDIGPNASSSSVRGDNISRTHRIAVVSDPHGDLVALRKVISDLERQDRVDEVLIGGDLAQGGSQPAETVDFIRSSGWAAVRGNADDLLVRLDTGASVDEALDPKALAHESLPDTVVQRGIWSAGQLGPDRIEYLRSLPLSLIRGPFAWGKMVLVHATPWSTEAVVLPDAEDDLALKVLEVSDARLLVYGHIHTQYVRRVGDGVLMSVGGVSGSNDEDTRPAYAIISLGASIAVEFRRVDWPLDERIGAYQAAGVELPESRESGVPGRPPFPVRVRPNRPIAVWP